MLPIPVVLSGVTAGLASLAFGVVAKLLEACKGGRELFDDVTKVLTPAPSQDVTEALTPAPSLIGDAASESSIPAALSPSVSSSADEAPNGEDAGTSGRGPQSLSKSNGRRFRWKNRSGSFRSDKISAENLRQLDAANGGAKVIFGPASLSGLESLRSRTGMIVESLFGDSVSDDACRSYLPPTSKDGTKKVLPLTSVSTAFSATSAGTKSIMAIPEVVHMRKLLTASVHHDRRTGSWIATINTNQTPGAVNLKNASKYLKVFAFDTQKEARESAYANSPPRMVPFEDSPCCFICRGKFALFRKPVHCYNCGVCVCGSCSMSWPSKMVPETYNAKKEKNVKACKSCNLLSRAFHRSLLQGNYAESVALYNTGNINLRCPIANIEEREAMYPVHCAAQGANLNLLRWLVDVHCCPISLALSGKRTKEGRECKSILTSRGRSVLGIAMSAQNVDMIRYLMNEKKLSVYEINDLNITLGALDAVVSKIPTKDALVTLAWDGVTVSTAEQESMSGSEAASTLRRRRSEGESVAAHSLYSV